MTFPGMNTHQIAQIVPADMFPSTPVVPRAAGRPGKYAPAPVSHRTLFRDGRPDRLLTLGEVLTALGIARSTWDRWRRSGLTPAIVVLPNGSVRIWESDLVRWNRSKEVE